MQGILLRDDIIDKKILHIWQTPWKIYQEEQDSLYFVEYCSTYVELDDGTIFEIQWQDTYEELPIKKCMKVEKDWLEIEDETIRKNCYETNIIEVLTSEYIPTFCLLLNNNYILYASDYGPNQTGPLTSKIGVRYPLEYFATYWGHKKIPNL